MYKRYIDDIFGIWKPSDDPQDDYLRWEEFKGDIDSYEGLEWKFWERTNSLDYLDIVITIDGPCIHTTLFEKELNLHLHIPPHSCHAPGVLTGLVLGMSHRIYTLCSDPTDIQSLLRIFLYRLRARGYPDSTLLPLFQRAHLISLENRPYKFQETDEEEELKTRIFFHTEYHPNHPKSFELQQLFQDFIIHPKAARHISDVTSNHGHPVEINKMTVAYSRPMNLGNLLSARNLHLKTGPPVSSYRK